MFSLAFMRARFTRFQSQLMGRAGGYFFLSGSGGGATVFLAMI
jgi:hypothetical protein